MRKFVSIFKLLDENCSTAKLFDICLPLKFVVWIVAVCIFTSTMPALAGIGCGDIFSSETKTLALETNQNILRKVWGGYPLKGKILRRGIDDTSLKLNKLSYTHWSKPFIEYGILEVLDINGKVIAASEPHTSYSADSISKEVFLKEINNFVRHFSNEIYSNGYTLRSRHTHGENGLRVDGLATAFRFSDGDRGFAFEMANWLFNLSGLNFKTFEEQIIYTRWGRPSKLHERTFSLSKEDIK